MPGTLYLVATPIGNLADITYRAVETLKSVAAIACEDTRQTRKLLDHYGIARPMVSYHEHNEDARTGDLLTRLLAGEDIALVSDAGTPLISDPGYRLVSSAAEAGVQVVPIPGASAVLSALSASGLPTDSFCFHGFAPRKSGERQRLFASLAGTGMVHVFYESPHRVLETLEDLERALGDPPVVAARELTKLHEEFLRGRASEVRAKLASRDLVRGEFTLVVGKPETSAETEELTIPEEVRALEKAGLPRMDAIKEVARRRGLPKREVYAQMEIDGKR
jgi:16S rRNA (cytidine1402-2'-O)-methyltransferase